MNVCIASSQLKIKSNEVLAKSNEVLATKRYLQEHSTKAAAKIKALKAALHESDMDLRAAQRQGCQR